MYNNIFAPALSTRKVVKQPLTSHTQIRRCVFLTKLLGDSVQRVRYLSCQPPSSTLHINPPYQLSILTQQINPPYQPCMSTPHINSPHQPPTSAPHINPSHQPPHLNPAHRPPISTLHPSELSGKDAGFLSKVEQGDTNNRFKSKL